jgi:hypothetical protein
MNTPRAEYFLHPNVLDRKFYRHILDTLYNGSNSQSRALDDPVRLMPAITQLIRHFNAHSWGRAEQLVKPLFLVIHRQDRSEGTWVSQNAKSDFQNPERICLGTIGAWSNGWSPHCQCWIVFDQSGSGSLPSDGLPSGSLANLQMMPA